MQKKRQVPETGRSDHTVEVGKREAGHFLLVCSDCQASDRRILGIDKGKVISHRNFGGLVQPTDISCIATLETGVNVLGVENIVVCGHYDCLAVSTAFGGQRSGIAGNWLLDVERTAAKYRQQLGSVENTADRLRAMCELNTIEQATRICSLGFVQNGWALGRPLTVSALMFDTVSGRSIDLGFTVSSANGIDERLNEAINRVAVDRSSAGS